jgi:Ca2+-binding EF-hand superfamily protein
MRPWIYAVMTGSILAGGTVWADEGKSKPQQVRDPEGLFKSADANGDGKLSKDEFRAIFAKLGRGRLKDKPELVDSIFKAADTDKNGFLSLAEFKALADRFKGRSAPEKPDHAALFKEADTNGDGKLSKDEFETYFASFPRLKDKPEIIRELFKEADADGDGVVTKAEFKAFVNSREGSSQRDPKVVFKKADANGDGKLSKDEFKAFAAAFPALKDKPKLVDRLFKRADRNGDGFLSPAELAKLLSRGREYFEEK